MVSRSVLVGIIWLVSVSGFIGLRLVAAQRSDDLNQGDGGSSDNSALAKVSALSQRYRALSEADAARRTHQGTPRATTHAGGVTSTKQGWRRNIPEGPVHETPAVGQRQPKLMAHGAMDEGDGPTTMGEEAASQPEEGPPSNSPIASTVKGNAQHQDLEVRLRAAYERDRAEKEAVRTTLGNPKPRKLRDVDCPTSGKCKLVWE